MSFVTSQVSRPYKSTDFTQALNILILVPIRSDLDGHTLLNLENDPLAFCINLCIDLKNVLFVALYCMIILQCAVQKHEKSHDLSGCSVTYITMMCEHRNM